MIGESVRAVLEEDEMDVVVGFVVGIIGLVGAVAFVLLAVGERAAREGRGGEELLVAPRGARFGDASALVLTAARAQAARAQQQDRQQDRQQDQVQEQGVGHAEVVHLHAVRALRAGAAGHAA